MKTIPKQLHDENLRFVKINHKGKAPFEKDWVNTNNYKYNDEKLINHLEQGGNYGVLTGINDLIVIDADHKDVSNVVLGNHVLLNHS